MNLKRRPARSPLFFSPLSKWRVISVDGQPRPVTMDYRPERLNFTIEGGKVIRVTNG